MDHQEEGYSYKPFFQKLYQLQKRPIHFSGSSLKEWNAFRPEAVQRLKTLLGWHICWAAEWEINGGPVDLAPVLLEEREETDRIIRKMSIQTLPGVRMPFWILIPKTYASSQGDEREESTGQRQPAGLGNGTEQERNAGQGQSAGKRFKTMLCLPAHGSNKDVVAGITTCPEVAEKLCQTPKEAYGREFCRRGYVAICPDLSGFGERQEPTAREDCAFSAQPPKKNPLGSSCAKLSQTAEALGLSLAGLESWDLKKLLDFCGTLPFVDAGHIGCAGFSGGGLNTMWIAALDERIRLAVISGYVHGYYNSILETHLCACNFVPGLWNAADLPDIASLIAPRPLFVENGREDPESGPEGIADPTEQVRKIRSVYRLFGAKKLVEQSVPEGTHAWYGTCYDFVDRLL